ncbi:MAG: GNAT family N-acetyltransferase [Caulobacterales bacterium]
MEGLLEFAVVPAGPADAAGLGRVHVKSWREAYPGLLPQSYLNAMRPELHARRFYKELIRPKPGDVVLLAEGADGPVGYCAGALLKADDRLAGSEVFTLYVLRHAQRAGVGRALLRGAARVFRAQRAHSAVIWVLSRNLKARRFYEYLGGVAVAERPVRGWGGGLYETAYLWSDIGRLTG